MCTNHTLTQQKNTFWTFRRLSNQIVSHAYEFVVCVFGFFLCGSHYKFYAILHTFPFLYYIFFLQHSTHRWILPAYITIAFKGFVHMVYRFLFVRISLSLFSCINVKQMQQMISQNFLFLCCFDRCEKKVSPMNFNSSQCSSCREGEWNDIEYGRK